MAEKDFWRNRLHADDREGVLAAYGDPAAGDEIVLEYRWLCRDGNYKWFYDRTIKKNTPTRGSSTSASFWISPSASGQKRKSGRMQARLQCAQKMEAIGTLAGGIAHDFNNLLMGIQGHASLMLLDLDPAHPHYERLKRSRSRSKAGPT